MLDSKGDYEDPRDVAAPVTFASTERSKSKPKSTARTTSVEVVVPKKKH